MIDVSDGVASEIFHICQQSGVGAFIEESGVPIHPDAQMMAIKFNLDPITCALSGGEDYELIFTINPNDVDKVKYLPDVYIMERDSATGRWCKAPYQRRESACYYRSRLATF